MNSNIIIRNIKLSLLSNIEMKEPYVSIYNELNNKFEDLKYFKCTDIHKFKNFTFCGISEDNIYYAYTDTSLYIDIDEFSKCYKNISMVDSIELAEWYIVNKFPKFKDYDVYLNNLSYINLYHELYEQ